MTTFALDVLLADLAYSSWASRLLLERCLALTDAERERDLGGSHASVLSTLVHVYDGERVWLDALRDTPPLGIYRLLREPGPMLTLQALEPRWRGLREGYARWLEGQTEKGLGAEIFVELPHRTVRFARWSILRHVLDHSTSHRGQVVGMIRTLGHVPPAVNRMDWLQLE
jgi:uncharacterized damage-inducible protein DinB